MSESYVMFSYSYMFLHVDVCDVVKELVLVCTCPSPINPFSVDVDYFESLPPVECMLASSAMLSMLTSILTSGAHTYNSMGKVIKCDTTHVTILTCDTTLVTILTCDTTHVTTHVTQHVTILTCDTTHVTILTCDTTHVTILSRDNTWDHIDM